MTSDQHTKIFGNSIEVATEMVSVFIKAADPNLAEVQLSDAEDIVKTLQDLFPGLTSLKAVAFQASTGDWVVKIENFDPIPAQNQAHVEEGDDFVPAWSDNSCMPVTAASSWRFCKLGAAQTSGTIQIRISRG